MWMRASAKCVTNSYGQSWRRRRMRVSCAGWHRATRLLLRAWLYRLALLSRRVRMRFRGGDDCSMVRVLRSHKMGCWSFRIYRKILMDSTQSRRCRPCSRPRTPARILSRHSVSHCDSTTPTRPDIDGHHGSSCRSIGSAGACRP